MPTIDLRSILQETVSGWYGDLVTRPTGHAVRRGVEELLAEDDGEQVAVIDFSSVRLLDLSCADEVIAKLLLRYGRTRPFLLCGISEDHQEALEPVLRRHGLAAVARDRMGRAHFLGVITERVRGALIMLAERGSAEVKDLADHLAVPTSAAREVLDELLERRLVLTNDTGSQVISIA